MENYCPECERKALLASLSKEDIEKFAQDNAIRTGKACDKELYQKRLAVCSSCPSLIANVLCKENGYYVAALAMLDKSNCPYPGKDKWDMLS
ncbi:MAG: DUF6171 family protein [Treponema sp.]|nr:DUF6171 family protein [Treponema sp.]